jgi:hypothetical protein
MCIKAPDIFGRNLTTLSFFLEVPSVPDGR